MSVNIVLVSLDNYQDYIWHNIKQLIMLGHKNIYVVTEEKFFDKFHPFKNLIKLISQRELNDEYNFRNVSTLNPYERGGFWLLASYRLFYVYYLMKKFNLENVIHLENDVPVYYNCDLLLEKVDKGKLYVPFDTYQRNIASIMYIPNHNVFKEILDKYDPNLNDMENFFLIRLQTDKIDNFPIFIDECKDFKDGNSNEYSEINFVCRNFNRFGGFVFDAAAMGQYLGGVDPRNIAGDTRGFINETCVVKYNNYKFVWKRMNENNNFIISKPFLVVGDKEYPIFNLHIHSKKLDNFIGCCF